MQCWASHFSDCGGKQSREHLFSQSLFDGPLVSVQGMMWCRDDWRTVPALSANILCEVHNNELSEIDEESADFKKSLVAGLSSSSAETPQASRA